MYTFNLDHIKSSLDEFRKRFQYINGNLEMRREDFTRIHIENILEGYDFLNDLLKKDIDLFSVPGMYHMLELNHIVLCGTSQVKRVEYYSHLINTRETFIKNIRLVSKWLQRKSSATNHYNRCAGFYSRALSFPQLFIEGNHRTENMIVNYYLIGKGLFPFIVTKDTAVPYLNISSNIKFSTKKNMINDIKRRHYTEEFAHLIQTFGSSQYVIQ